MTTGVSAADTSVPAPSSSLETSAAPADAMAVMTRVETSRPFEPSAGREGWEEASRLETATHSF